MSYDLAIWVGPKPENATAASTEYARRMDAMEVLLEGDKAGPPAAPEIVAFVEAALARFPELNEDSGVETPWASAPLMNEVVGDLIYFPMTFSGAEYARDDLAEIAASHGLVCYDPQIEDLLPNAGATTASEAGATAAAALAAHLKQRDERPRRRSGLSRFFRKAD